MESTNSPQDVLSHDALSICRRCGAVIWVYPLDTGGRIALDNASGGVVLANGIASIPTTGEPGYRAHQHRYRSVDANGCPRSPMIDEISADQFLWL